MIQNGEVLLKMYKYNASLVKVIDGDTVDAIIDLGFKVSIRERIRLWKIDAPEIRSKNNNEKTLGKLAKKRLKELLSKKKGKFKLISHGFGKFGRCLGEIYVNNRNINNLLLKEGLVKKYGDQSDDANNKV